MSLLVRSQDQIAYDSPQATGVRYTKRQVESQFGQSIFDEIDEFGAAVVVTSLSEPSKTLRERRESMGFDVAAVARRAGVAKAVVENAESSSVSSDFGDLVRLAIALNLPRDLALGRVSGGGADTSFAARLKKEMNAATRTQGDVWTEKTAQALAMSLSEAAWVVEKQYELDAAAQGALSKFDYCPDYGSKINPAYEIGYELAHEARELLGFGKDAPIISLRTQVMEKLHLPLIQLGLPKGIAGATVCSNRYRGVVLNTLGDNSNVWVRRFTLAHELGHLFWDEDERLDVVNVDNYSALKDGQFTGAGRFIEARANAFAAEFLAPREPVAELFGGETSVETGIRAVMELFGVNFLCARHQVMNGLRLLGVSAQKIANVEASTRVETEPSVDWVAREDSYPFFPAGVSNSRRGKFSEIVVEAVSQDLITRQLASLYLGCTPEELVGIERFFVNLNANE